MLPAHLPFPGQSAPCLRPCRPTLALNGVGKDGIAKPAGGLGTAIVEALVKQLDARIDIATSSKGTRISIAKATFVSRLPEVA